MLDIKYIYSQNSNKDYSKIAESDFFLVTKILIINFSSVSTSRLADNMDSCDSLSPSVCIGHHSDEQTYTSEFDSHCVPNSCSLVLHLSKKLSKL